MTETTYTFTESELLSLIGESSGHFLYHLLAFPGLSQKVKEQIVLADPNRIEDCGFAISPELRYKLFKRHGVFILNWLKDLNEEEQIACIEKDRWALLSLDNPTSKVRLLALSKETSLIERMEDITPEEVELVLNKTRGAYIDTIGNFLNEEQQLKALDQCGENNVIIKYFKNPSEKVRLEAIKLNGWSIGYVTDPTEEECLLAINEILFEQFHNDYVSCSLKQKENVILNNFFIKDILKGKKLSREAEKKALEMIKKFKREQKEKKTHV